MIGWVRAQAKKSNVHGIMAHKLDRMCRNMGDAVLLRIWRVSASQSRRP